MLYLKSYSQKAIIFFPFLINRHTHCPCYTFYYVRADSIPISTHLAVSGRSGQCPVFLYALLCWCRTGHSTITSSSACQLNSLLPLPVLWIKWVIYEGLRLLSLITEATNESRCGDEPSISESESLDLVRSSERESLNG